MVENEYAVTITGGAGIAVADSNERIQIVETDPSNRTLKVQAHHYGVDKSGELCFYLDVPTKDYVPFFSLAPHAWVAVQLLDVARSEAV